MKTITNEELAKVLELHSKWLLTRFTDNVEGQRADLAEYDLSGKYLYKADLQYANLQYAYLQNANLQGANLQGASLRGANLQIANLQGAHLQGANLQNANLQYANLRDAGLQYASLQNANLQGAYLQNANLQNAYLQGANLTNAKLPHFKFLPEEGKFIAYKKVQYSIGLTAILKLEITGKRMNSLVGRKCRTNKAKVLSAMDLKGKEIAETTFYSLHNTDFEYTVGKVIAEAKYDDDIRIECTQGIHFFMTFEEARDY